MAVKYPSIPQPTIDPNSLRDAALALKETVEVLTRQRGSTNNAAVTWGDLVNLGVVSAGQVPASPAASVLAVAPADYKLLQFTRVLSVASGDQSVQGVGFKPRLIALLVGANGGSQFSSIGVADGLLNSCVDVVLSGPTVFLQPTFCAVARDSGSAFQTAVLKSFDTDGFTLTWAKTSTPSSTATITAVCFR